MKDQYKNCLISQTKESVIEAGSYNSLQRNKTVNLASNKKPKGLEKRIFSRTLIMKI